MPLPHLVHTVSDLREQVSAWRKQNETVALVPTMGALHEGHLSLIELAQRHAGCVIASIFVNPTQFGPNEDFDSYPRVASEDIDLLSQVGCDAVYLPSVSEIYPAGFATTVHVSNLDSVLCGKHRPGHFDGVTTVVCKLLLQTQPDHAIFGEKDWQQLAILRRMTQDLNLPVRLIGAPVHRETDGLAMSSRNRYLSPEERTIAPRLHQALLYASNALIQGEAVETTLAKASQDLLDAGFQTIDYFDYRDAQTLQTLATYQPNKGRLLTAAHLGKARLIDNIPV